MTTFAILATGPSMSQALADSVRGRCGVIAVSDAWRLAPWADALVSQDLKWWEVHGEARQFEGRKFGGPHVRLPDVERMEPQGLITTGTNSGLLGAIAAVQYFGATRILLLGFDLKGTHYFGRHPAPLKNTTEARYAVMREQFSMWHPRGVQVLNCTPGSALECYPKVDLCAALG